MHLLVIEDERALCETIVRSLRRLAYSVDYCYDGEEALALLGVERYDLVLLDLNLPKKDGMTVLRTLRQTDRETRVLILSARSEVEDKVQGLDAGANDYLAKPIEEEKLHALLLRYQPGVHSIAPAAIPPAEPVIDHNQTLDWQLALRQAAMKPDLAREMLQMLIAFMPEVRNKVEEQLVGEQPEGLVDLIHKLHGSCSYSGVPRLKKLCHTLESQLRAGTAAEDLEPELLELLDEMDNVAREACRMGG